MGVTGPGEALMLDADWRPTRQNCFLCGESVWQGKRFVYWHGNDGTTSLESQYIVLHAECAVDLGAHLCKDGLTAQGKVQSNAIK